MVIDRVLIGRVVKRLSKRLGNLKRAARLAQLHGNVRPFDGQDCIQAIQDAIEIIKAQTITKNHRPRKNPSLWDRWANGNQYGSYNSDEE